MRSEAREAEEELRVLMPASKVLVADPQSFTNVEVRVALLEQGGHEIRPRDEPTCDRRREPELATADEVAR